MKVFYAARLARFDLLRAVANLSRYVTKWTCEHDKHLMKLMQYIKCTLDYRQVGWIGDDISKLNLHLYADTNFGGSQGKSTTGVQLNIEGPNTFFPMEGMSIAQTAVAHSTPESEIMAAWTALRKTGFPALVFWEYLKGAGKDQSAKHGRPPDQTANKHGRPPDGDGLVLPGQVAPPSTSAAEVPLTAAMGATAAEKRARIDAGLKRREDKVKTSRGDDTDDPDAKLYMHDDNTAMIAVVKTRKNPP